MKKLFLLIPLVLNACSSTGYHTANHNGKMYYFPPKCSKYTYSNNDRDTLYCYDKGVHTGAFITPATQAELQSYYTQQDANQKAWTELNQTLKNSAPKTTYTNCFNSGYNINCQSNTY